MYTCTVQRNCTSTVFDFYKCHEHRTPDVVLCQLFGAQLGNLKFQGSNLKCIKISNEDTKQYVWFDIFLLNLKFFL